MTRALTIDISGEQYTVSPTSKCTMGRVGDVVIDDNPYLHRHFLHVEHTSDFWWLSNVGNRTVAYLADDRGLSRSTLVPGSTMPLVFGCTIATFSAGPFAYELKFCINSPVYESVIAPEMAVNADTTIGSTTFTETQLLAILALAEPLLRRVGTKIWEVPTAVQAAKRLGWTQTRFNRKLDNVCDKLDKLGVRGLRGSAGSPALERRAVLAEYAVTTGIVTPVHLAVLEAEVHRNQGGGNAS